ncbi:DgyrCDS8672 [Dimorphilus gyrociliatus]|uniref:Peptidase M20 domain-containing protein 2 n=1 Tax=Dimorphilus gyrociliatus TaxID=2664684 RepID=A0A7I8VUS4_9ANNE|nr:DgyrCDS8672 [Dimorphilus gyrociliatus]
MMTDRIDNLKTIACRAIDDHSLQLKEIGDKIWENPELGLKEYYAHDLLTKFFSEHGFDDVEKSFVTDTAFRVTASNPDPKAHVAVLCEYDALPEIGHACGHNLIAEAGASAALGILAAIKAGLRGKLTVFGTPAEESDGGKLFLIDKGAFKDVDAAMMVHPAAINSFKTDYLSIKSFCITYRKSAHHELKDIWEKLNPLDAAIIAYNSISALRSKMRPTWRIHGIIADGGVSPCVLPEKSVLKYYLRTPTEAEMISLEEDVRKCFDSAAIATNCTVEIELDEGHYKSIQHNDAMIDTFSANAKKFGIISDPYDNCKPSGSTDMGNVSHEVPSIHPKYALATNANIHTREFAEAAASDKSQIVTIQMAKTLAMTAIDLIEDSSLMKRAKDEFNERKTGQVETK